MLIQRTFIHLKMTSERSKRRDFLSLIFISKSISKKLLIFIFTVFFSSFDNDQPLTMLERVPYALEILLTEFLQAYSYVCNQVAIQRMSFYKSASQYPVDVRWYLHWPEAKGLLKNGCCMLYVVCKFDNCMPTREDKGDREGILHTHPIPQVIRLELFLRPQIPRGIR